MIRAFAIFALGALAVYALNDLAYPESGSHAHRCRCGNVWEHSDAMRGNTGAHTCGACGSIVWKQDSALGRLFA